MAAGDFAKLQDQVRKLQSQVSNLTGIVNNTGFPFTGTLITNEQIGSFSPVLAYNFVAGNTPYTITHALGRKPNGYIVTTVTVNGAVLYYTNPDPSGWTDRTIVLRATLPCFASFLVF